MHFQEELDLEDNKIKTILDFAVSRANAIVRDEADEKLRKIEEEKEQEIAREAEGKKELKKKLLNIE